MFGYTTNLRVIPSPHGHFKGSSAFLGPCVLVAASVPKGLSLLLTSPLRVSPKATLPLGISTRVELKKRPSLKVAEKVVSSAISISDPEFDSEVLNADKPVLVYFWSHWCGPCRLVSPSIEWLADNYSDRLKVIKMEVDPNPEAVRTYKVEGVPALRLFRNQEVIESREGAMGREKLQAMVDNHLN
jgi:thioredoxin 1